MAYTPINWQTGDTITAEKMNKMDNGWSVESTQLFSETVTTTVGQGGIIGGALTYSGAIDADSIIVTFDGTDYTCTRIEFYGAYYYGGFSAQGPDFSVYPFALESHEGSNVVYTSTAGTYTIAVSADMGVAISDGFKNAVTTVAKETVAPLELIPDVTTIAEANEAQSDGKLIYFYTQINGQTRCFIITYLASPCEIVPTSSAINAKFDRDTGVFYIQTL